MEDAIDRHALGTVREMLETFRVVLLGGARQTGKTTLAGSLLGFPTSARLSFDDAATLARAIDDPVGFVNALPRPAAVDEFQRAGQGFLLAVKQVVDHDRTRGQFLLTGSASYLAARGVTETLAGRTGRIVLWPLSQGERRGVRESFLDHLFETTAWPLTSISSTGRSEITDLLLEGGFPEIVTEKLQGRRRHHWFNSYVQDVVSREALKPIADVRMERELRHVLHLLAARTSQELVLSDLASDAQLSRQTTANYVALLEALYLVYLVPAWATSATTRAKRHPKIHLVDTGLAADLCGVGERDLSPVADGRMTGALLETFVVTELHKQATWSDRTIDLSHFRDRNGPEVDLIVEDRRSGIIAGVEIKATATPTARHARSLQLLRDRLDDRFSVGIVLHTGTTVLSLGDRLWAVPVSTIWA